jgi:lipoprotein-anchoring transpeptidase ErfK/SrfK
MAKGKHGKRRRARGWKIALVVVGVLAFTSAGTAYAAYRYDQSSADRILPGVTIDGVDVSNMSRSEAIRTVTARSEQVLDGQLSVETSDHTWVVTPAALGMTANVEASVEEAFAVADEMSFVSRVYHRAAGKSVRASIELTYAYDDAEIQTFVQQMHDEVAIPAVNARFALGVDNQVVMRRPQEGQLLKTQLATARIRAALEKQAGSVKVPLTVVEPDVSVGALGKTIVVDVSATTLTLYDGFKVEKEYRVATAAAGYTTPVGTWKIVNKAENPSWTNPDPTGWGAGLPGYIAPGPGNPLGTRALYLNAPGIRIHGTYSSSSIGTHASHGCIRMLISESEELYPLVPIGTRVLIVP